MAPLFVFVTSCASGPIPASPELRDARTAMARLEASPTRDLAPADVDAAREALAVAERAEVALPGTRAARDLAYVARRKAERARMESQYSASVEALAGARRMADRLRHNVERQRLVKEYDERAAREVDRARRAQRDVMREALDRLSYLGITVEHEADRSIIEMPSEWLFYWRRTGITQRGTHKLGEIMKALAQGPPTRLTVVVEDDIGSFGGVDPATLAQRRVQRVRELMIARGGFAERIAVEGRAAVKGMVRITIVEVQEKPPAHAMSVATGQDREPLTPAPAHENTPPQPLPATTTEDP